MRPFGGIVASGRNFSHRRSGSRAAAPYGKALPTWDTAEYHGEFVNFDPMITRPTPTQKPCPPILLWSDRNTRHSEGPGL
jgi:alkanesulfonate monooxygenase SsuD/methylene tetrahydromethanopterin reductase-like flavin-dependent oxidoreductase (luciferase family)